MRLKTGAKITIAEGAMMCGPLELEVLHIMQAEDQVVCKWFSIYSSGWKYSCFQISELLQLKRKGMVTYA